MSKLLNKIKSEIEKTFYCFNAEEGAQGGGDDAGSGDTPPVDDESKPFEFDSPEEAEAMKALSGDVVEEDKDKKPEEETDPEKEVEPEPELDDNGEPVKKEPVVESEYQDDIIEGLTGEEFEKLPDTVKVGLAKTREAADAAAAEAAKIKETLAELKKHPLAAKILDEAERGETPAITSVPGIGRDVLDKVRTLVDEGKDEEANQLLAAEANKIAMGHVQNESVKATAEQVYQKTMRDAGQVLIDTMSMNKDLDIGEKDPMKIAAINKDHPKFKEWDDGMGKVVKHLRELQKDGAIGDLRKFVIAQGKEGMAALVAKVLNKPLVLNADKQINDQIMSENEKLLKRFKRGGAEASEVAARNRSGVDRNKAKAMVTDDGIDKIRLVKDSSYHDQKLMQLMEKEGERGITRIEELFAEGERYLTEHGDKEPS